MVEAFSYPYQELVAVHGPVGYSNYEGFRKWVRDEFAFRCVYCLKREQWGIVRGGFELDHFEPQKTHAEKALVYENLVYSCRSCNSLKGSQKLPDPRNVLIGRNVILREDGHLCGTDRNSKKLILALRLDDPTMIKWRQMWISIVKLAKLYDPTLYGQLMGFPDELPNLRRQQPPKGNQRKRGLRFSFHALKSKNKLPQTYLTPFDRFNANSNQGAD